MVVSVQSRTSGHRDAIKQCDPPGTCRKYDSWEVQASCVLSACQELSLSLEILTKQRQSLILPAGLTTETTLTT